MFRAAAEARAVSRRTRALVKLNLEPAQLEGKEHFARVAWPLRPSQAVEEGSQTVATVKSRV
jgi:hypothetical protein